MLKSIKSACTARQYRDPAKRKRGEPNVQTGNRTHEPTARPPRDEGRAVRPHGAGPAPRGPARESRATAPDTSVSTDRAASWAYHGPPSLGLCARSVGPGFQLGLWGKEPRVQIRRRPSRGASTHSAGQRHRAAAGCRPRHPRSRRRPIVSLHPKLGSHPCVTPAECARLRVPPRQRTLTELANTPVASVEMITSRHAHVGITRPTSTSRTILTPMKTRSSATACCRYWNDLISPTTNV